MCRRISSYTHILCVDSFYFTNDKNEWIVKHFVPYVFFIHCSINYRWAHKSTVSLIFSFFISLSLDLYSSTGFGWNVGCQPIYILQINKKDINKVYFFECFRQVGTIVSTICVFLLKNWCVEVTNNHKEIITERYEILHLIQWKMKKKERSLKKETKCVIKSERMKKSWSIPFKWYYSMFFLLLRLFFSLSNITKRIEHLFVKSYDVDKANSITHTDEHLLVTLLNAMCRYAFIMAFTDMVIREQNSKFLDRRKKRQEKRASKHPTNERMQHGTQWNVMEKEEEEEGGEKVQKCIRSLLENSVQCVVFRC